MSITQIIELGLLGVQVLLSPILLHLARSMSGILREFREVSHEVERLKEWRDLHDKQDDERHRETRDYISDVDQRARANSYRISKANGG